MTRFSRFALLVAFALLGGQFSNAQGPGGGGWGGGGWGGGGPGGGPGGAGSGGGGFGSGGFGGGGGGWGRSTPEETIQKLDPNKTGFIDIEKIESGRTKFSVQRAAQDAGLDTSKPIPVDKLKEALEARSRSFGGGPRPDGSSPGGGGPSSSSSASSSSGSSSSGKDHEKTSAGKADKEKLKEKEAEKEKAKHALVPGFGTPEDAATVPGFGDALALAFSSGATSGDGSIVASGTTGSTSSDSDDQYRKYAESLMKQYDTNKDGVLEKDEWKNMRNEPEKAANSDGVITLAALIEHVKRINRSSGSSSGDSDKSSGGFSKKISTSSAKGKRFSTPTDRLPEGLPAWFIRADLDGDGQVTMAEFSTVWNDAKVAEFAKYDLNGDGIITAAEALKVEKGDNKKK